MKTVRGCLLLAPLCVLWGCIAPCKFCCKPEALPEPPAPVAAKPSKPAALVTADQVNKKNAREMAESLRKELDFETR